MKHGVRAMVLLPTLLFFSVSSHLANAQQNEEEDPTSSNFQPSLFVVIGVLAFMFSLTFMLIIYARFCHREPSAIHNVEGAPPRGMFGTNTRFSGIDKAVVEALPYFRFSSLKGSKQGLQCSVCLAEFGEVEVLRLLPKCKHGFHIGCIDQWLESHSTCPLCRQKVSADDLVTFEEGGEGGGSSILSLFVERESHQHHGSSKFSIGGSFRRILKANKEEEMPMKSEDTENLEEGRPLHRLNHQIVVSDVMFKNRWSNVSSSDFMFLNSEMLGIMSSHRFSSANLIDDKCCQSFEQEGHYRIMNLRDEMERKVMFEQKVDHQIKRRDDDRGIEVSRGGEISLSPPRTSSLIPADKRAMSEITAVSRFKDLMSMKTKLRQCLEESNNNDSNYVDDDDDYHCVREDIKRRKIWFPIAMRTVQWFADREKHRSQQQQQSQDTGQKLDV